MQQDLRIIEGALAVDDRGSVSFVNGFDFSGVKRFYKVENFSTQTIRAFHGHLKEGKYVYLASGSAIVAAVPFNDPKTPDKNVSVKRFVLSAKKPSILFIPPGYANGFKPLEENTTLMFFSTSSLEESKNDDFRFDANYWGEEVWQIVNR